MNKHRNSYLSEVEQIDLKYQKFVVRHNHWIQIEYRRFAGANREKKFINNEEGC
jgi:hypothetical protein